jgi:hypothetical protein
MSKSLISITGIIVAATIVRGGDALAGDDRGIEKARAALEGTGRGASRFRMVNPHRVTHLGQPIATFETAIDALPVFFHRASVQLDEAFEARRVAGRMPRTTTANDSHPRPGAAEVEVWTAALGIEVEDTSWGWIRDWSGALRPVVRVDTAELPGVEPLSLYLDTVTGRVIRTEPVRWAQETPLPEDEMIGAVFEENPITTPEVARVSLPFLDEGTAVLSGRYARAASCIDVDLCKETTPRAFRSDLPGEAFVFAPRGELDDDDDPFAEVNTYYHITTFNRWMRETFGWKFLFGDSEGIDLRVGRRWSNAAYYVPTDKRAAYIVFGRDDEVNFAYDADVVVHEFSHAVIQSLWKHSWMRRDEYGIDVAMSGIEEAVADMWAESYSDNPVMDGYVTRSRSADNDYTCPRDLYGEGHLDALFLSAFGWDVREGIGRVPFEHILYRTMPFLEDDIDYADFVEALEQSARDLASEGSEVKVWHAEAIRQEAVRRGLLDDACLQRLVPLLDKETRIAAGYGNRLTNQHDYPFGLQWKIETPENVESFKLFLKWHYPEVDQDGEPVAPGFRVHVRRGEPVEVRWLDEETLADGEAAFEVVCHQTFEGAPESIEFPLMDMAPARSGEAFYVLFSADSEEPVIALEGELRFSARQSAPPPSTLRDDTGVDGDNDAPGAARSRDGSCRVAAPGAARAPFALTEVIGLFF